MDKILFSWLFMVLLVSCNSNKEVEEEDSQQQQLTVDTVHTPVPAPVSFNSLPSMKVMDMNGKVLNLRELKGKKVFVNLWASWCPPCRREMPSIRDLSKTVNPEKVAFVMLSMDDDFSKAKQFVANQQIDLPIYYPAEKLPLMFNVEGIPTTFLFDEEGNLIRNINGAADYNTAEYRSLLQ